MEVVIRYIALAALATWVIADFIRIGHVMKTSDAIGSIVMAAGLVIAIWSL